MSEPTIFSIDGGNPEMRAANANARATFKYLWRELSWEYRRIVRGLGMAAVKMPFAVPAAEGAPPSEHMWINELEFDGETITGVLLNQPQWVDTLKPGDKVSVPLSEIDDWMYTLGGHVYGGYTIDVLRQGMSKKERQHHDQAWGLDFGDPGQVAIVPTPAEKPKGLIAGLFAKKTASVSAIHPERLEHPMSENMGSTFREGLQENPSLATAVHDGWSMLQREALGGNYAPAAILLEFGADPHAVNANGHSALDLARKDWLG